MANQQLGIKRVYNAAAPDNFINSLLLFIIESLLKHMYLLEIPHSI